MPRSKEGYSLPWNTVEKSRPNRSVVMAKPVADELQLYLQPNRNPQGLGVLSVEKQLGIALYYLKDEGSLMMTAKAFGVGLCTASVIAHKVCDKLVNILGPT